MHSSFQKSVAPSKKGKKKKLIKVKEDKNRKSEKSEYQVDDAFFHEEISQD